MACTDICTGAASPPYCMRTQSRRASIPLICTRRLAVAAAPLSCARSPSLCVRTTHLCSLDRLMRANRVRPCHVSHHCYSRILHHVESYLTRAVLQPFVANLDKMPRTAASLLSSLPPPLGGLVGAESATDEPSGSSGFIALAAPPDETHEAACDMELLYWGLVEVCYKDWTCSRSDHVKHSTRCSRLTQTHSPSHSQACPHSTHLYPCIEVRAWPLHVQNRVSGMLVSCDVGGTRINRSRGSK